MATNNASYRTKNAIPVCAGISGLGKTRMLEEGRSILRDKMGLPDQRIFSVIVPYYNGFGLRPVVERSMPIEASFSWRLFYRFFLDQNCLQSFKQWMNERLPVNREQLTLAMAIQVIALKLRQKRPDSEEVLYLFLGIDEYQAIEKVQAKRQDPETSLLRELVEAIGSLLCAQSPHSSSGLVLLPMFAGTDWGVIQSTPNEACYATTRLPMALFTMNEILTIGGTDAAYAELLECVQICRDLAAFGGVPRWVVEYLSRVKEASRGDATALSGDPHPLSGLCYSGLTVFPEDIFYGDIKWSRLRDASLCLLTLRDDGAAWNVQVPYALLQSVGLLHVNLATEPEKSFAQSLNDLKRHVDDTLLERPAWQSWAWFGACFYAVRINALRVLGHTEVPLHEFLPGARMTTDMAALVVKLAPSRVFRSANPFGASTAQFVSEEGNEMYQMDWTSSGSIVMAANGEGADAGVDIFFALDDATTRGKLVVVVDRRKRHFGTFQPATSIGKMTAVPRFLEGRARFVRGIMNCAGAQYTVPPNCFLMSRDDGTVAFHGTLASHPADPKVVEEVADEIVKSKKRFLDADKLTEYFLQTKRLKVTVDAQFAEFSS